LYWRCRELGSCCGSDPSEDVSAPKFGEAVAEGCFSSYPTPNGALVTQLLPQDVVTARICYNEFYEEAGKGCVHWAQFRVRQSLVPELPALNLEGNEADRLAM
jgi:hypothetical protein